MRTISRAGVQALVTAAVLACVLQRHAAASEGESALSIALGVGTWHVELAEDAESLGPTVGGLVLASYERGFTDALSWRVDVSGGLYGRGGTSWSGVAAAGVVYRLDVIKYVPYGLLELGAAAIGDGPVPDEDSPITDPVLLAGIGLDVLRDRSSSWGIEARAAWIAGTTLASLSARYTWRWGFF